MKTTIPQLGQSQHLSLENESEQKGKSMMPPDFKVTASALPPPVQKKGSVGLEISDHKNVLPNELGRDKILGQSGNAPDPNSPNAKEIVGVTFGKTEFGDEGKDKEDGFSGPSWGGYIEGNAAVTKRGGKLGGEAEIHGTLAEYNKHWHFGPMPVRVFGEMTAVDLVLRVRGSLGAEAAAQLDGNLGKIQSTKDISNISVKNMKYGLEGKVDAFAGLKLEIGAEANYEWIKKSRASYVEKFRKNASYIVDEIAKLNAPVGALLHKMPLNDAADTLSEFLYGLGEDGQVNLAEATASVWGGIGVGLKAAAGARITKGKFYCHYKAGVAWGLGFGHDVALALDLLEGTLFGLAAGGEMLHVVIPELRKLITAEHFLALGRKLLAKLNPFEGEEVVKQKLQHRPTSNVSPDKKVSTPSAGAKSSAPNASSHNPFLYTPESILNPLDRGFSF